MLSCGITHKDGVLDLQFNSGLDISAVNAMLAGISVSGQVGLTYDNFLFTGDLDVLVVEADLGFIVFSQKVSETDFTDISLAIKAALAQLNPGKCYHICPFKSE